MQLKFLLIEPVETTAEVIEKNLQREFGAVTVTTLTAAEGVERLKKAEHFDLIVARNFAEETAEHAAEPIAELLLNALYDFNLKTPLIVIGEFEHTYKQYALVSERLRIEEINRLVLKALDLKKEDFNHLKLPDYIPFPIRLFFLMSNSPCDIYIKLVKKTGEEFVKRLHFGETFNREDLLKYEELGLKEFFVLRDERELFMNGLLTQSLKTMKALTNTDEKAAVAVVGDSFVISSDLILTLGISPAAIAMVDQTITHMKSQINKSDKLGQLLKRLLDNQLSYSFRRSYLISLLSHTLLPKMEWGSGDQQSILLDKLMLVSFFHDIYLEEERFLKIMDNESFRKADLTPRERDLILNHANRAAMLVQSYPKLPQGVDMIIKQHHGVSNGVGFPEVLTASISPMAVFFIVVEDFVTQLLTLNEDTSRVPLIIKNTKERFQLPSYRKVATELENIILKK